MSSLTENNQNSSSPLSLLSTLTNESLKKIIYQIKAWSPDIEEWNAIYWEDLLESRQGTTYNFDNLRKILDFFSKDEEGEDDIIYTNDKELYFLNYMTAAYRSSDLEKMLKLYKTYITRANASLDSNFLFFVNSSFMLIEKCLAFNCNSFAKAIIMSLSSYLLYYNYSSKTEDIHSSPEVLHYLHSAYMFTSHHDLTEISFWYQCNWNWNISNYEKAKENLSEFKEYQHNKNKKHKQLSTGDPVPLSSTIKQFYSFLKVRIDYINNIQYKCYKQLNTIATANSGKDIYTSLFYYNSLGILNWKQKNFFFAEYCFRVCEAIIRKHETITYSFLNNVWYNISLCYFFNKKYEKCYKLLSALKTLDYMSNNPFLFYRLGLCCLEKELADVKNNFSTENMNDIVCKIWNEKQDNDSDVYNQRIVWVNNIPTKNTISGVYSDTTNENIIEAIAAFKQCLLIIKGNCTIYQREITKTFNDISKESDANIYDYINKLDDTKQNEDEFNENKTMQYSNIYPSAYLNLLFCLLRNENYLEVIHYANSFITHDHNINSNNGYRFIVDNYWVESYLKMNNNTKAIEVLNKENMSSNIIDTKGSFYANSNRLVYSEVSYRIALYINLIKVNLGNNKVNEAEKYIHSMLSLLNYPTENEIPPYVLNIIIYYWIVTKQNDLAVKTLKYRKVPTIFNK